MPPLAFNLNCFSTTFFLSNTFNNAGNRKLVLVGLKCMSAHHGRNKLSQNVVQLLHLEDFALDYCNSFLLVTLIYLTLILKQVLKIIFIMILTPRAHSEWNPSPRVASLFFHLLRRSQFRHCSTMPSSKQQSNWYHFYIFCDIIMQQPGIEPMTFSTRSGRY